MDQVKASIWPHCLGCAIVADTTCVGALAGVEMRRLDLSWPPGFTACSNAVQVLLILHLH